ncbi:hypothetical protein CPB84DRAFT_1786161 [Gymnopilus junonius]|uniref:Uncharacterized protein n=1 Tax=Gymnopilus junonius TaxID=109634 RepID=A0A9P5NIJ6_GYMJU|nr:hypothetical protein CPB84DRAFT_1786161 [Gymnopilus junonius]
MPLVSTWLFPSVIMAVFRRILPSILDYCRRLFSMINSDTPMSIYLSLHRSVIDPSDLVRTWVGSSPAFTAAAFGYILHLRDVGG